MTLAGTRALPYPDLERATAGLHAELRRRLLDEGIRDAEVTPRAAPE